MQSMFKDATAFNNQLHIDASRVTSMWQMFTNTPALSDCNKAQIAAVLHASNTLLPWPSEYAHWATLCQPSPPPPSPPPCGRNIWTPPWATDADHACATWSISERIYYNTSTEIGASHRGALLDDPPQTCGSLECSCGFLKWRTPRAHTVPTAQCALSTQCH